jgi:hypothetical protein
MTTVERCVCLDLGYLSKMKALQAGVRRAGTLYWPAGATRETPAQIHWMLDTTTPQPWVQLRYFALKEGEVAAIETLRYRVRLLQTPQHYGGVRWWFCCPLGVDGKPCTRRVRQLYLPPGERYFGCRHCYSLTYESRQHRLATSTREAPAITVEGVEGS